MVKVHTLYLSTLSPAPIAPIVNTNPTVVWNINWDSFFGETKGEYCRVKFVFTSKSSSLAGGVNYNTTLGSLRANFTTRYANNYNGVNLGLVNLVNDPVVSANHRFLGDTSSSIGVEITRPTGNQAFQLQQIDLAENIVSTAMDYQVWLYFEFEEE